MRRKSRYCRQCGANQTKSETKPLDDAKIKETQAIENEVVSEEIVSPFEESQTGDTVPLVTQQIILTDEVEEELIEETVSENVATVETQSTDVASVWAIEKDEDENEAAWTETSPTVALSAGTIGLVEPTEKAEYQTDILQEVVIEELPEDKTLEAASENSDDENELTAREKSRKFVERAKSSHLRVKSAVMKSQRVLDQSSADSGLRFAIISVVVFLLALALFLFSRYLK